MSPNPIKRLPPFFQQNPSWGSFYPKIDRDCFFPAIRSASTRHVAIVCKFLKEEDYVSLFSLAVPVCAALAASDSVEILEWVLSLQRIGKPSLRIYLSTSPHPLPILELVALRLGLGFRG